MKHTTHIYENAELSARAVADLILGKAKIKQQQSQFFNLAVSGGATPKYLFSLLAEEDYRTQIPWENVRFFWVDERCVEPTDSESNFGMTYDALLQYAFVPADNIFRMKGEDIPENEANRYKDLLRNKLPAKDGFPVFDLVLLGLGDDGHTASIFPDNLLLLDSEKSVEVATHPVSGQKRITLTGRTINNAREVVFLINGSKKAKIVEDIIKKTPAASAYPAFYVHNAAGESSFYLDKEAVNF
jgi:6-phosphogluconolactonase